MNFKRAFLFQAFLLTLNVHLAVASENPPLETDLTRCEGWFNPESEARNMAEFEKMMGSTKVSEPSFVPATEDEMALAKTQSEITDEKPLPKDSTFEWTPERKEKLEELVGLVVQMNRDLYDIHLEEQAK